MRLFLFFPLFLWATINEPLRVEFLTGYRQDRIHWHIQEAGEGGPFLYSENNKDLQFWQNGLSLKVIHRDLVFYAQGMYALFGSGVTLQRSGALSFTSTEPRFTFSSTDGWGADALGYFGYAVNLTDMRLYKVLFIPLIGYSAHFARIARHNPHPNPFVEAGSFSMQSSLPSRLHQSWYGVLLGSAFQIEPGGRFVLQAGYSFHWVHMALKNHMHTLLTLTGSAPTETNTKVSTSQGGNRGSSGWVQIDYLFSPSWHLGFGGQIYYLTSGVLDAKVRQNLTFTTDKLKLRWTTVAGWAQLSREF